MWRLSPGLFETLIFSLVLGTIWGLLLWFEPQTQEWMALLAAATLGLFAMFVVHLLKRTRAAEIRAEAAETRAEVAEGQLRTHGLGEIGIDRVYKSIEDALPDFTSKLATARLVRVYLQIGGFMLAGPHAPLFKVLQQRRSDPTLSVEFIVGDKDSQFLTEQRLQERRHDVETARSALDSVHRQIEVLRRMFDKRLQVRYHREPFTWAVFFLDDVAYFAGYFAERENRPPIYRLIQKDLSLYQVFDKHFQHLQAKYPLA